MFWLAEQCTMTGPILASQGQIHATYNHLVTSDLKSLLGHNTTSVFPITPYVSRNTEIISDNLAWIALTRLRITSAGDRGCIEPSCSCSRETSVSTRAARS